MHMMHVQINSYMWAVTGMVLLLPNPLYPATAPIEYTSVGRTQNEIEYDWNLEQEIRNTGKLRQIFQHAMDSVRNYQQTRQKAIA